MSKILVNEVIIEDCQLPEAFEGTRVAFFSDLHEHQFGRGNEELIRLIEWERPDYIFVTGDLIDHDIKAPLDLMAALTKIAPVYFVPGNHEYYSKLYPQFKKELEHNGIHVFKNNHVFLTKGGQIIALAGVEDPVFIGIIGEREHKKNSIKRLVGIKSKDFEEKISLKQEVAKAIAGIDETMFTMLLSHRPEQMEVYRRYPINLVFSGHAHGGQLRLPGIGGVLSSGQGLFPKYDSGVYDEKGTKMVVTRGLGSGALAFRINNPPELILLVLKKKEA